MCGYPFFIPEFVLFTNSSLFWFKIANERSEFRNYLLSLLFISSILIHLYIVLAVVNKIYSMSNYLNLAK